MSAANIETAKALLKKALALNDKELIALANSMFDVVDLDVFEYKCNHCNHSFKVNKEKKSCPKCRKRKLTEIIPVKENTTAVAEIQQIAKTPQPLQRGNRQGRREPVRVGKNTWVDTKEVPTEEIDQKIKAKIEKGHIAPSIRNRGTYKPIKVTCVHCSGIFDENPALVPLNDEGQRYYVCGGCAGARR